MGNQSKNSVLILLSIYIILAQFSLMYFDKGEEVILCSQILNESIITLFKWITRFGEWISLIGLGIVLIFKNKKHFLITAITFLICDILMLMMKKILDYPRPLAYFTNGEIQAVKGYDILLRHSMPSGHSFTVFFVGTFISLYFSISWRIQFFIFVICILVGLSRIILLCHFKEDVIVGSLMGISTAILAYFFTLKYCKSTK